jgi:hypothetical protein
MKASDAVCLARGGTRASEKAARVDERHRQEGMNHTSRFLYRHLCAHCGIKEAACYGAYENEKPSYACNDCCGHGCEDGRCWPISPGYEVGMTEKDAERQFEIKASTLSREQIYLMAKELWCELISKTAENVRLVEREAKLKATLQVVAQMRQAQKALLAKHNEDNVREVNRLQSAVDYRLAELKIHAI